MDPKKVDRRAFLSASLGVVVAGNPPAILKQDYKKLAILGGRPIRDKGRIGPPWPYVDDRMVEAITTTTRSGIWSRIQSANGNVPRFEKAFATAIGAKYSLGTGSGTQALNTCVEALGIGAGDEVITSPYTDFGTLSAILTSRALPVLADLDPDSYQLDPDDVEQRITKNTKAIMPVHIMGLPADMDRIMAIAKKHTLRVIEDACQAPFARYRGQPLGLIGDLGCFSFQASKAIACGEGGAVVGNDEGLMEQCFTVHNRGASRKGSHETIGPKYRMNEFEGALLLAQLDSAKERFEKRNENARYLSSRLRDFPALVPQKQYPGTESGAYYHYGMTFHPGHWNGATRAQFLKAINAEGIGLGSYIRTGLHREPWVDHLMSQQVYRSMYGASRLKAYKESMQLPNCDRICNETLVSFWASGALLGTREEMDHIVDAIMKVYENRDQLRSL